MSNSVTMFLFAALAATSFSAPAAKGPSLSYELFAAQHARLANGETSAQLQDALPGLAGNLKIADQVSADYWADCTPFDELAKAEILPDKVLEGLGIPRKLDGGVAHVPAGTMHTYGYLFSQLKTAYGLKGKRWIESRLDERLGLPAGTFSPFAKRGEFTSNVTAALLKLAGEKPKLPHAAALKPSAKELGRLEQHITWKTPGKTVSAVVVTRLLALKPVKGVPDGETALLVYEVVGDGQRRLVTAFPVDQGFVDGLAATPASKEPAFKPRFNLFIDPSWTVTAQRTEGFKKASK